MKKLFIVGMMLVAVSASAQTYTVAQRMIQTAVEQSLLAVKTSYQLQDTATGDSFGRRGRDDFNSIYTLAVKTQEGILLAPNAISPWLYDAAFERYRNQYRPAIKALHVRHLTDSTYGDTLDVSKLTTVSQLPILVSDTDANAMCIQYATDTVSGWLVWVFLADSGQYVSNPVYATYVFRQAVDDSVTTYPLKVPTLGLVRDDTVAQRHLIGGIFVEPHYGEEASIKFNLAGLVVQVDTGWNLLAPFRSPGQNTTDEHSELQPIDDDQLTPLLPPQPQPRPMPTPRPRPRRVH